MKLFLCNTPLQTLIASRIIEIENIQLHDCALLYVCDSTNKKAHKGFVTMSSLVKYARFVSPARSISGIQKIRRFIKQIGNIDEIFIACIDDSLAHYAISFSNCGTIKSFDDGTANIVKSSPYFERNVRGGIRALLLGVLHRANGNRYSLERIKFESVVHYSIYDKFKNVMSNVKNISLYDSDKNKKDMCSVFTGVNYNGYCNDHEEASSLRSKVRDFLKVLPGDVIYIGNIKKDKSHFHDHIVDRDLIVEETVMSVIDRYKKVDLYGFADLPQNLFMDKEGVTVKPVIAKELSPEVAMCVGRLSEISGTEAVEL